MLRRLKVRTA